MRQMEFFWAGTSLSPAQLMDVFELLHRKHAQRLRAEIYRRSHCLTIEDQEDLEQEIWKAVWQGLPRFQGRSRPSTWLIGVARHVIFSWLKLKQTHDAHRAGLMAAGFDCVTREGAEFTEQQCLQEELSCVERRYAAVLRLRYFEQLSDQDVARRLELPLGTIKSRIRIGLKRMRILSLDAAKRPLGRKKRETN